MINKKHTTKHLLINALSVACSLFGVLLIDLHSAHLGNIESAHMRGETDTAPFEEIQSNLPMKNDHAFVGGK